MKDPTDEIITALYTALSGNVTYNASQIPVYTHPLEWEDINSHYVQIGASRWDSNLSPKDRNLAQGQVEINIFTYFEGANEGSQKPANSIGNTVAGLIDQELSLSSFVMLEGRVESAEIVEYELDPAGAVYMKILTFTYKTEEV